MGSFEVQINPTKTLAREESDSKTHFDCVWKLKRRARSSFWTACFEKIYFVTPEISYIYIYIYKALTLSCKKHTHEFEVSLSSASLSAFQQFHENPPKNSNSRMSFYGIPRHDCTTLQLQGGLEGISFFKTKAGHQDVSNSEAPHRLLDENWHLWKRVRNGTELQALPLQPDFLKGNSPDQILEILQVPEPLERAHPILPPG